MREDPARRFVVGYTIEDTSMRLWFCSRSNLLVTAPFNFLRVSKIVASFPYPPLTFNYAGPRDSSALPPLANVRDTR